MLGFGTADQSSPAWEGRRPFPFYAERGAVAAAHPLTVEAGLAVQRQGGNAVDVAVSSGLAAAVVMPEMCGLGGDLFAVLSVPNKNGGADEVISVQGSGISPRDASLDLMREHATGDGRKMPYQGPLSISVPGMVDGFFELLERYGTMSFAQVAEPAIALADNGFPLQPLGAKTIANQASLLAQDPAASAIFLANGNSPRPGDRLIQTDLAETLKALGKFGADTFYRGAIGKRITAYLHSLGGKLSEADLAEHATEFSAPLKTTYRGHTVYQTGLPSQGLILLEALNIVEHAKLDDLHSAATIHLLVEAKKRAFADRLGHATDPAFHNVPLETLLSKSWAKRRYEDIDQTRAASDVPAAALEDGDTTYIATADGEGMMVSLIQSVSSAFGSGIVGGDTGVLLNNRAGRGFTLEDGHVNIYAPGKKTMHTLNAYLVADPEGRPVLVGGTPGGDGQPQWNLQAITGLIDGGLDVQAAIDQPRWTSWPGTDPIVIDNPFELRIEDRVPADVVTQLEQMGHTVRRQGAWNGGGAAQIIARDPERGLLIGGSDPRVEGTVLGR